MHYKKCVYCDKEFYADRHQTRYCSMKCRRAAQEQRNKERDKEQENYIEKTDNKPHTSNLLEINRRAREAGMSYGKYVAMQYIKEHKNVSTM